DGLLGEHAAEGLLEHPDVAWPREACDQPHSLIGQPNVPVRSQFVEQPHDERSDVSAALPQRRDGHRGLEVGQELPEREPGVEARVGQGGRNIDLLPGLDYLEDEVAESLDAVCCEFVQVADYVER